MEAIHEKIKQIKRQNDVMTITKGDGYCLVFGPYSKEKINEIRSAFTVYFQVKMKGGIRKITLDNCKHHRIKDKNWEGLAELNGYGKAYSRDKAKRLILSEGKESPWKWYSVPPSRQKKNIYNRYTLDMSQVQAVLFDVDEFTPQQARDWLRRNKKKAIKKVHRTENYLRYRLREPEEFKAFRTVEVDKGIKFIIGIP